MKTRLHLILLLLTLSLPGFGTSPQTSPAPTSAGESATVSAPSDLTLRWAQVLPVDPQTAQVIGEEIDVSLKASWEEGYKAARVEFEPLVDYWKAMANPDRFWDGFLWGILPGVTLGVVAGVGLLLSISNGGAS